MSNSWRSLEQYIRHLGQIIWDKPLLPERIDGVNFDAVADISDEENIIVEITEEHNLNKIRTDVAKILAVKMKMAAESIVVRAYIVMNEEPTPGMVDIGKPHKIHVISAQTFANQAFNFGTYATLRETNAFGSSIDPITGKPDHNNYIPVSYITDKANKSLSINEICDSLARKNRIILLGDYGTGKSRCVREAFQILKQIYQEASAYPLAINLREHWGAQSGIEIISGHFSRLGLSGSIDRAIQLLQAGSLLLLLDGFDEVGTQTFGNSENRRASIRMQALTGVRDLLNISKGGVLITGRPHYFNDNEELMSALGLSLRLKSTQVLKCREEFEDQQANAYLTTLGLKTKTPKWLPKKPLMFQIIASMESSEAEDILNSPYGEVGFWGQFIDTVCIREAKMHPSIESTTVRSVLGHLARMTRTSHRELGRLTPKDVQHAYELTTGYIPDESGQLMLSRLCTLGRIEPESPDRQFIDPYIVQLLFADCIIDDISHKNHSVLEHAYNQPLQAMGLYFLAQWIETYSFESESISFIHRDGTAINSQVMAEIIAALLLIDGDPLDFRGLKIVGAEICFLALGIRKARNIEFEDGIIQLLSLDNCIIDDCDNFSINKMEIIHASGLSSNSALPSWIKNSKPLKTDSVSNATRIKSSPLPAAQKLFLSIIQKIFFQRGGGRKETSIYKGGFGQNFDRKLIEKILSKLIAEGIIEQSKDSSGFIYNPKREYTSRMRAIRDQLSLSKDPLWLEIATMN
ncbi:hypothetical protein A1507_19200 [Methylomonas koyamae]|uniref:NACHT domain-containing protein n=1 Tax=Methylomonas koyamae TaxID=702114 RepID=A0A177N2C9_9GAMM|nr:hypothetical protein [Methylomonas koyamae]OAI12116.1 hypothetical protein A1507_19200 [Methylomonas koyamae]